MRLSRRTTLKFGLGAGVLPFVGGMAGCTDDSPAPDGNSTRSGCRPMSLSAVRLTGGPLKRAQDLDARYLKRLEPDRMLAFYRERAGLAPRAEPYGGWDGDGRNLTGHIGGHYLSAVSLMWAATGDPEFKRRADYVVAELKLVQDAHGDGFLSALENLREAFARLARGDIESQSFDLNGLWAPWYTLHKTFGGLRDAYRYTGNTTALEMEIRFAEWAERVLADLDERQLEHMMNTEFGGMNEVLVDLYADTGEERWLALSYRFEHDDFLEPLRRHRDNLSGKHGNTQIPKLIGSADRYAAAGDPQDILAAAFFWDRVVHEHSFATGGHGRDEYFGPPGRLSARVDGRTAETCNVYNMLKLTRRLFAIRPDVRYADFHERALYNHILGSMDSDDGSTCYMVPVGRGVEREYQDMLGDFTCCVGSGMESHALHGDGLYYEDGDRLYVNLYAPSTAAWESAGATLACNTGFPSGETAKLTIGLRESRRFTLSLRRPDWAGEGFAVTVNGKAQPLPPGPATEWCDSRSQYGEPATTGSRYVDVDREWRDGDVVEIALPKSLWLEPTPDNPRRAAIMWGPLVLAGDLGPEHEPAGQGRRPEPPPPVPVLVAAERPVAEWLKPEGSMPGTFVTDGVGRLPRAADTAAEVRFRPFHSLNRRRYAAYFDLFTPGEWQERRAAFAEEAERQAAIEAATIAYLEPGETWFERDFNYRGGPDASSYRIEGRPSRRTKDWFAYDLPVEPGTPLALILGFHSHDRRYSPGTFRILIDGELLTEYTLERSEPPCFFDERLPIPRHLVEGKDSITLRFEAAGDSQVPAIFRIRLVRARERA